MLRIGLNFPIPAQGERFDFVVIIGACGKLLQSLNLCQQTFHRIGVESEQTFIESA